MKIKKKSRLAHDFSIAVHPGKILREVLVNRKLSQSDLARHLKETTTKINEICRGKRGVSAEMAIKFSRAFKQSPEFWLNLQKNWELSQVDRDRLDDIEPIRFRA